MKDVNIMFLEIIERFTTQLSKVDIKVIANKCQTLMASDIHGIRLFSRSFIKKLFRCSHSFLLKLYLLPFITWFDYTILKELLTMACEKDDILKLFSKFINNIDYTQPITSYPIPSFSQLIIPLDDSEYTIIATETIRDCYKLTLKDIKDVKELLQAHWELTEHAIQLAAVDCKHIYWMIPKQVKPLIEAILDEVPCNEIYLYSLLPTNFFSNFDQQNYDNSFFVSNFSSQYSKEVCKL